MKQGIWRFEVPVDQKGRVQTVQIIEIPFLVADVKVKKLDHDCQGPDCQCAKKRRRK